MNRWENMNLSIMNLAIFGILSIVFFFITLVSYTIDYQGVTNIFEKKLPLSIIIMVGFGILFLPIYYVYGKLSGKTKIKLFRRCLKNNDSKNTLFSIIYIVIIVVMFIASFILFLMNIP